VPSRPIAAARQLTKPLKRDGVDDTIEPCNRARRSGRPARLCPIAESGRCVCNPRNDELTFDPYVHLSRCEIARPITQSLSASERSSALQ